MTKKPNEEWHSFNPDVAKVLNVQCGVVFELIDYWLDKNSREHRNFYDGEYWTFNSCSSFEETMPYFEKKNINNYILKLIEADYLKTGNYNRRKGDRTRWFTLSDKGKSVSRYYVKSTPNILTASPNILTASPNILTASPKNWSALPTVTTTVTPTVTTIVPPPPNTTEAVMSIYGYLENYGLNGGANAIQKIGDYLESVNHSPKAVDLIKQALTDGACSQDEAITKAVDHYRQDLTDGNSLREYISDNLRIRNNSVMQDLLKFCDSFSEDIIKYAVDISCSGGHANAKYVSAILSRWEKTGYKTMSEVIADTEEFERKKEFKKTGGSERNVYYSLGREV